MAAAFKVIKIENGNTIQVSPGWVWKDGKGDLVEIIGYNPTDKAFAVGKLSTLLLQKEVELKNAKSFNGNTITCSVYLNDIDVAQYFPEFKVGIHS